ncbi:MAG: glycosyltransferase family 4 protein [Alphaproteobacteria bacterium]
MRVVLGTIGKFHTFDLGRELYRHGALERVFSGYPWFKLRGEGLPRRLVSTYPWVVLPRMALARYGLMHGRLVEAVDELSHRTFGRYVARHLPPCDIFHGLSRYSLWPGLAARRQGAKFILDVGSSHMTTQLALLEAERAETGVTIDGFHPAAIEREYREYAEADLITVPSEFSLRSFVANGVPREKLAKVIYGVDLRRFSPVETRPDGRFRVLFVGGLSLRKGIHYLVRAFARARIPGSQLILVGSRTPQTDILLRGGEGLDIVTTGHIPQPQLREWYSRADVFVLPSVEDGYGLVLLQALACGCPVIASANTGGPDCVREGENGFIVPARSVDALAERLVWFAEHREQARAMRAAALASASVANSVGQYGDAMMAVYAGALGGAPGASGSATQQHAADVEGRPQRT